MLLCILKNMDFGVLEWAVLGNVVLLLVLLVVLFYTICRLRKATRKNQLEETLPYSDTSDLVPQRYSTLCGLKSGNNRQNGISILSSTDPLHDQWRMENSNFRRMDKSSGRLGNFLLEKSSPTSILAGPPTYFSATLPLPSKKNGGGMMMPSMKFPMHHHWAAPPPSYWIALSPTTLAPASQSSPFQYVGPYTTLPAVLKKHQRCRHQQQQRSEYRHNNSSRLRAIDSASPGPCMFGYNCGKKQVHMQEDL